MRAKFSRAVGPGGAFPEGTRREIIFCGRSNVGKSSLLNALTGVQGLARTSKTPGRTREIHFYEEGTDRFLVDLPGYGYARVSQAARRAWGTLVESYLARADRIALAILLVDARHPPFDTDLSLAASLASRGIPFLVALTKADRATMSERARALALVRTSIAPAGGCILTSSRTGAGMRELAGWIDRAIEEARSGRRAGNLIPPARSSGRTDLEGRRRTR